MIKFLVVAALLVLLFGGAARMIVAGGAKSLNLGDRLLGRQQRRDVAGCGAAL